MAGVITRSPGQFTAGLEAGGAVTVAGGPFAEVLVAGMGGSWMAAALVADARLARVPVRLHRSYDLPEGLDRQRTLVIAYSFSGNTEECLSAYDSARKAGCALVGVSAGGQLQRRCQRDGVPHVRIPADPPTMQPRSATGYGVGIITALLDRCGIAAEGAVETVAALADSLRQFMPVARQRGTQVASELGPAVPVVYASPTYGTVARIWKIKFNENAKTPAFWNVLPELNHNEMIGWTQLKGDFHLIFLSDPADDPRILARQEITREMLAAKGLKSTVVTIEGGGLAHRIFSTLLVGDWASYELAIAAGIDPSPVAMVEDFKRLLRQRQRGDQ